MLRHARLILAAFLAWCVPTTVSAQSAVAIAPGDLLAVTIDGQDPLSKKYLVEPDGAVLLPLVGRVEAAGLTVAQMADKTQRLFGEFFRNARVRIELVRPGRVFVFGEAPTTGPLELTESMTVLEALTRAGYSGTSEVLIVRPKVPRGPAAPEDPDAQVIRVSLLELEKEAEAGVFTRNVLLIDGDTIYVPRSDAYRVSISGEVRQPGLYPIAHDTTVLQVVALAGGTTEDAALGRVRITRLTSGEARTFKARLTDTLEPQDSIVVPATFSFPLLDVVGTPANEQPGQVFQLAKAVSVTIGAALKQIGVDTNVFNEQDRAETDFTVVAGPQVSATVDLQTVRLTVTPQADFVYYAKHASERSIDRGLSTSFTGQFTRRIRADVSASVTRTHERLNAEVDARVPRREARVSAQVLIRPLQRLELSVGGADTDIVLASGTILGGVDLADTLTEHVRSVTGTIKVTLTPITALEIGTGAATHRFERFPLKNADASETTFGVLFKPRALVSGAVHVGYLQYSMLTPDAPDLSTGTARLDLSYRVKERTQLGFTGGREAGGSFQTRFAFAVIDRVGGSLRQGLFSRYDVVLETYRENFDYRAFFLEGVPTESKRDRERTQRYTGEFGVRAIGGTRVGLNATYVQRLSSVGGRRYGAVRVGATFSYGVFRVRGQ